jgi:cytochrome P450 family 6
MKFVESCLDETLRIHPVAPFISRLCTQNYKIPNTDVVIEKGTTVFIPISGVQRDEEIFENPLEFRPERFLKSGNGSTNAKGTFYLPFSAGPSKFFY